MGKFATIRLELFKAGIRAVCDDLSDEDETYEEFIARGDGDALLDFINEVEGVCDPEARFALTEKGKKSVERLRKEAEDG